MPIENEIVKAEALVATTEQVQHLIHEIRGERVILDRDLAKLYGVEVRTLNQAVKRNMERFPNSFMFQLNSQEFMNLKSQFVITRWGGDRAIPYAFTEQGVAMLSAVLKSPTAIQVSIAIMEAFVQVRRMIADNHEHTLEINAVKTRLSLLEQRMEENLGAVNDLSEDMRHEIDNIYQAIGELSIRQHDAEAKPKPECRPIGYEAIKNNYKKSK